MENGWTPDAQPDATEENRPVTHYQRLGIGIDATPAEVRDAFRGAVRALHPDRHGEGTTADMAAVNRAWWVLSDPARRSAYDAGLQREEAARHREDTDADRAASTVATPAPAWDPDEDWDSDEDLDSDGPGDYPETSVMSRLRSLVVVWGVVGVLGVSMLFLYGFCRSGSG
jgi:curved DNA-binding protein CbpA